MDSKRHSELRAAIARERERRHWTIPQWRELYPAGEVSDEWPSGMARVRKEADDAVDSLLEQLEAYEKALRDIVHLPDETQAYSYADACVNIARAALNPAKEH
jgi:hypothetical protein